MPTSPPRSRFSPPTPDPVPQGASRWARFRAAIREHATFARAVVRSPRTVGAVCPSSRALARAMVAGLNLRAAGLVVELGPGTGSFTRVIAERLGPGTEFLALELDEGAVRLLRQRFPGLRIHQDSAERLGHHVRAMGRRHVDYVVSGLPWAILPAGLQERIMEQVAEALVPGGVFTTFAYLHARRTSAARRYWQMLPGLFGRVELSAPVWTNFPPAVVYRCVK